MLYDAVIVGAGPAGSRVAAGLAQAGWQVVVLEEHPEVGAPVHCTGIVGEDCMSRFDLPAELVQTQFDRFLVVAPSGETCLLPGVRPTYALDRRALDSYLAGRAQAAGATFRTGVKVRSIDQGPHRVTVRAAEEEFSARCCVLACGAMSNLPERCYMSGPSSWYRSVQADHEADGLEGAEIYLGRRFTEGSFAWTVRSGQGRAKAGLITPHHARHGYANLMESVGARIRLGRPLCRDRFRRMPMGLVAEATRGLVAAVGDAAGQIKTTTGGGIYFAMLCADILAATLLEARRGDRIDAARLSRYDARWKAAIGAEVTAGLVARRLFEQIDDDDISRLVSACQRDDVREVMARHWHFDFHGGFLVALSRAPQITRLATEIAGRNGRWQRLLRLALSAGRLLDLPSPRVLGTG